MSATSPEAARRGWILLALVVLALLAAADGLYLTLVHVDLELGKPGAAQLCHKLASQGCDVTGGRFGDVAGIPVATIGFAGAIAIVVAGIGAFIHRRDAQDPWRSAAYLLGLVCVLASVMMAVFSTVERSYCPFCLAWYGLNLGIAAAGRAAIDDPHDRAIGRLVGDIIGRPALPLVAAFALSLFAGLMYAKSRRDALLDERELALQQIVAEIRAQGPVAIDLTGLPSHGPDDAEITIVEVADFECPFCKKVWDNVKHLRAESDKTVRTVFVHYPLDNKCNPSGGSVHEMACGAALAAECARRHDKFWEYGDLLFQHQPDLMKDDLIEYAGELGLDKAEFEACMVDDDAKNEVRKSIARATALNVSATPTFYVNGYEFRGALPKQLFLPLVQALLGD